MDYRIETKDGFDVFGIETVCLLKGEKGYMKPSDLWQQCHTNGEYERLFANAGTLPNYVSKDLCKIHAVENYKKTEENTYSYMLFSFVSKDSMTDGYQKVHIPSQTYAIFPSERFKWSEDFNKVLSSLQKKFYTEWLPTAEYVRADGPNFEIYGGDNEYGYIELWFPIIKK